MRNPFNTRLIEAMEADDHLLAGEFPYKFIEVSHSDGSKFHFKYAKMQKTSVPIRGNLPCIIVFAEHNSPQIFVEYDLDKLVLQPWKGKAVNFKLEKDPSDIDFKKEPSKHKKPKAKKVVKKVSKKKTTKKKGKLLLG